MDMEQIRKKFEERVFNRYTAKRAGMGRRMRHMPNPMRALTLAELCEREGDDYKREDISAMWYAWQTTFEATVAELTTELRTDLRPAPKPVLAALSPKSLLSTENALNFLGSVGITVCESEVKPGRWGFISPDGELQHEYFSAAYGSQADAISAAMQFAIAGGLLKFSGRTCNYEQLLAVKQAFQHYQDVLHEVIKRKDVSLSDGPLCQATERLKRLLSSVGATPKPAFVLIQEGGTSAELYLHSHASLAEAEQDRVDCSQNGAYRTSPVVEVPGVLDNELFYSTVEAILKASHDLECV